MNASAIELEHVDLPPEGSLRGEDFADMQPRLDFASTIDSLIAPGTLAAVIGPSGSGKTFFSTDMGCCVAADRTCHGREVTRGLVVYGALEGAASARNRFSAWRQIHLKPGQSIPLRAMTDSVNLRNPVDQLRFVEFIRRAESKYGQKCSMVFVDTLSRAIAGGNENGPEDMGALVAGADAIRNATGAAVLLVAAITCSMRHSTLRYQSQSRVSSALRL
jgi:RecA-family ATPase